MTRSVWTFSLMAAAAVLFTDPRLSAQIPGQDLPPPPLAPTPTLKRGAGPTLKLRLTAPTIREAVAQLQKALEEAKMPEINVIIGPNADGVSVPELTLRNVSGADGLRLIAAAAGCQVDPIPGEDSSVIGYRLSAAPPPVLNQYPAGGPGPFGGINPPIMPITPGGPDPHGHAPGPAIPGPGGNVVAGGAGSGFDPSGNPPNVPGTAPQPGIGFAGAGGVIGFGTPVSDRNVRVYPLASITTLTTFGDVEKTLREVLQTEGIAADTAKLAMHEKTNVLVVAGDERVHGVVTQLLDALQKNTASATVRNNQEERARFDMIESRVRLEAMQHENKRLDTQLQEAEAKLRDLQRELDRAKAADAKPR